MNDAFKHFREHVDSLDQQMKDEEAFLETYVRENKDTLTTIDDPPIHNVFINRSEITLQSIDHPLMYPSCPLVMLEKSRVRYHLFCKPKHGDPSRVFIIFAPQKSLKTTLFVETNNVFLVTTDSRYKYHPLSIVDIINNKIDYLTVRRSYRNYLGSYADGLNYDSASFSYLCQKIWEKLNTE